MKRIGSLLWRKAGSLRLTIVLCLLIVLDLAAGYFSMNRRVTLFAPMNDTGLATWIATYGRHNLAHTAWFFALMGLLALLCVNTFVCTTNRVASLLRHRPKFRQMRLWFRLAPHGMHYATLLILAGYLCSYLFAEVVPPQSLIPGASASLPGTDVRITFESMAPRHYRGDRLDFFDGRVIEPNVRLLLSDGTRETRVVLNPNRPTRFRGYGIFLKNFAPRQIGGMDMRTRVDLNIRKDPGIPLYFGGILLFLVSLLLYAWDRGVPSKPKKEIP